MTRPARYRIAAGPWRRTAALERAAFLSAALLLAAVVLHRPDLVVLAAPFAVGSAVALASSRSRVPFHAELTVAAEALLEDEPVLARVTVEAADRLDLAVCSVPPGWVVPRSGTLARSVHAPGGVTADIELDLLPARWGRVPVGPVQLSAVTAYGLLAAGPALLGTRMVLIWPLRAAFEADDTMPKAEGTVGPHRSRRPGEGTELAGVRPFQPGDRLKRINWRVSLRTGATHVTTTLSDRDTDVLVVLDSRLDVGGSLDAGVRAAIAISEHYLRAGDRVGVVDLGQPLRRVPQGNGRAHLARILDLMLDSRGGRPSGAEADTSRLLRSLPKHALVLLLTPVLGEQSTEVLAALARTGGAVVAVDTLPEGFRPDDRTEWTDLAWRISILRREADIGRLNELGVPVVPWRGAGSLDDVLRDVTRSARLPRVSR